MKKVLKYIFLFILFFCSLQFIYFFFWGDELYNFGFSYAISRGEVPYRDFNMIVPPFGALFYTIPFLFGNNILIFNLFQALLLCILFYLLYKMMGKNIYAVLAALFLLFPVPLITVIFPGYNFLLIFLLVLLLYLEKNNSNDILIGIILGLMVLTKHTVGFLVCLVSFFYLKRNYKKVLKRILGVLIVGIIFIGYLLITNTWSSFFDMCFLGMFDFTKLNSNISPLNLIIFLIGESIIIYRIYKNKRNIENYYLLAFSIIVVPLFDYYHVALFIFMLLIIIIKGMKIRYKESILLFNSFLFVLSVSFLFIYREYHFNINFSNFNHFSLLAINKDSEKVINRINKFIDTNKDKNIIFLCNEAYLYEIMNDRDITQYDLLNYGNHGYNGTEKLILDISKEKNPLFIINISKYKSKNNWSQLNKEVIKYVLDNYTFERKIGSYVVYS